MKRMYYGRVSYGMIEGHPDWNYVSNPHERQHCADVFAWDDEKYFEDDFYGYVKEDLLLAAGGGYNWDFVKDARFAINECSEEFSADYKRGLKAVTKRELGMKLSAEDEQWATRFGVVEEMYRVR